jgi:CCR4-NOT transcription complex subunit 4
LYLTANDFVRMLRESKNNNVSFAMHPWKLGTNKNESRFALARWDNQGSMLDPSFIDCSSEKNVSLLPHNSLVLVRRMLVCYPRIL